MERLLNRKDVPYEFWNVLGPNGQFLHRTWRIRNNFNASDMTEELVNEANAVLAYEASTVMDKDGKEVPIRETRPVPVNEIIRIRAAQKKKEEESGKPLDKAQRDLHSIPEPLPEFPLPKGIDEGPSPMKPEGVRLKEGGSLKKVPRRGVVPDEPIKSKILTPDKLKPQVRDDVAKMKMGQKFKMEGKMYKKVKGGIVEVK
jgi:hypothetical protein